MGTLLILFTLHDNSCYIHSSWFSLIVEMFNCNIFLKNYISNHCIYMIKWTLASFSILFISRRFETRKISAFYLHFWIVTKFGGPLIPRVYDSPFIINTMPFQAICDSVETWNKHLMNYFFWLVGRVCFVSLFLLRSGGLKLWLKRMLFQHVLRFDSLIFSGF